MKLNHNETLSYPNTFDQTLYASVEQAFNMGAVAVGATIYFGSEESRRQIEEISAAFERAHELGLVTVLWAYLRNPAFKKDGVDYHVSADLTGQANHLAATIGADIVKQKMAENNGGYKAVNFGYTDDRVYSKLTSENPIDLVRYQLANCYMGRAGLINSGGAAGGETDLSDAVRTAVINKRAGGMGLILGRKAFKINERRREADQRRAGCLSRWQSDYCLILNAVTKPLCREGFYAQKTLVFSATATEERVRPGCSTRI